MKEGFQDNSLQIWLGVMKAIIEFRSVEPTELSLRLRREYLVQRMLFKISIKNKSLIRDIGNINSEDLTNKY